MRLVLTGGQATPRGTRCVHSGPKRPSSTFTDGSREPNGRSALRVTLDTLVGETQVSIYRIRTAAARRSGPRGLAAGEDPGQAGPGGENIDPVLRREQPPLARRPIDRVSARPLQGDHPHLAGL